MGRRTGREIRPSAEGVWAAEQGLEPQLPDPESGVLPLDDSAVARTTTHYAALGSRAQAASQGGPHPPAPSPSQSDREGVWIPAFAGMTGRGRDGGW